MPVQPKAIRDTIMAVGALVQEFNSMQDANGHHIGLGQAVVTGGMPGVVVCSMDTDEYAAAYPKADWTHLTSGILVETQDPWLVWVHDPVQVKLKNSIFAFR
jgi:hypothetical protein